MSEDPAAQAKLAALGYAMSTTVPKAGSNGQEADPRTTLKRSRDAAGQLPDEDSALRWRDPLVATTDRQRRQHPILYYELGDCYVDLRNTTRRSRAAEGGGTAPTFAMADWIWGRC